MLQSMTRARPYARAAFACARSHHRVAHWAEVLDDIALLVANEMFADYLANPKVSAHQGLALLTAILTNAIDEQLQNFLRLLATARQLDLVFDIVKLFKQYVDDARQIETVTVYVANALTVMQQEKLQRALAKRLQKQVTLSFNVIPELIGGAVICTKKWIIDGSVIGRLAKLKTILME